MTNPEPEQPQEQEQQESRIVNSLTIGEIVLQTSGERMATLLDMVVWLLNQPAVNNYLQDVSLRKLRDKAGGYVG